MMEKIIVLFLELVNTVVLACLHGFTLATLWGWFVVTAFGAPVLTIPLAIGLYLIVRYLTVKIPAAEELDCADAYCKAVIFSYTKAVVALLAGLIVKQFV